jgi:AraC family transcriptional regulator
MTTSASATCQSVPPEGERCPQRVDCGPRFQAVASSLAQLLETARRELERDRATAKASLATASSILRWEIERWSGANGSGPGGLAGWQIARVRAFIDENLHRTIPIRDLSAVARRSTAHFSRSFKQAFGEPPHAYVMRRRLERACHLMMTSSDSLAEIALRVGFSDQSHLCKLFRQAFGQSPSRWRRERDMPSAVDSEESTRTRKIPNERSKRASTELGSSASLAFSPRIVEAHQPMRVQAFRPELPLNDSMKVLSVGLPGREKSNVES